MNQPGSAETIVSGIQSALQQSRLIYNDFGFLANGLPLSSATAFNYFKMSYGDVGRNTFFGDNFYLVNAAIFKTTRINERMRVEFRAEAANLLNRRNFGVPDPITGDAYIATTSTSGAVSTFQNPGFNNGGACTLRLGLRFLF